MRRRFLRTTWDLDIFHGEASKHWMKGLQGLIKKGYEGLEVAVQFQSPEELHWYKLVKGDSKPDWQHIAQIHTCGYPISSDSVKDHIDSLKQGIEQAMAISPNAINVHSGRDYWSIDQTLEYFKAAEAIQKTIDIPIFHETHRQRALFTPYVTKKVIQECGEILLNADLSHWVLVGERLYNKETDPVFFDALKCITPNIRQIHARVGSPNQIQVIDVTAEEEALDWYTARWNEIFKAQDRSGKAKDFFITCEFGPFPYAIHLPKSSKEIYPSAKNNDFMMKHLKRLGHPE